MVLNFTEVAAVIRWKETGVQVETAYNQWLLKQVGVFRTTIEARNSQTDRVEAVYKAGFRKGGSIQIGQDGQQFAWKINSLKKFELLDNQGNSWAKWFLEVNPKSKTGLLETTQERIDEPEFEVAMVLGWYLCVTELGFTDRFHGQFLDGTPGNGGPTPSSNGFNFMQSQL